MAKGRLLIVLAAMIALVAGARGLGAFWPGPAALFRPWAFIPPVLSATAGLLFIGQRAEGYGVLTAGIRPATMPS